MAVNRNEIVDALFARLAAIPGLKTSSRRLLDFDSVDDSQMPALFLTVGEQQSSNQKGLPTVWRIKCNVYLYVKNTAPEGPGAQLLDFITAVEAALEMQPGEATSPNARFANAPTAQNTTLGGLASGCWISGSIESDEGALGDLAVAIIPIDILTVA